MTQHDSTVRDRSNEATITPPEKASQTRRPSPANPEPSRAPSSPPEDTQALSQFVYPPRNYADEVEDEAAEGVWGYLIPLDDKARTVLVLRKRDSCEGPRSNDSKPKSGRGEQVKKTGNGRKNGHSPGGYLVGRHPECGRRSDILLYIVKVVY